MNKFKLDRSFIGRNVNRALRGKNWVNTIQTGLIAYLAIRQMQYFNRFSDAFLISLLLPLSAAFMWGIGYIDEIYGIWKMQKKHMSGVVNPVQRKILENTEEMKQIDRVRKNPLVKVKD